MSMDRSGNEGVSYDDVPLFRKRWFLVITMLFFVPATLLIVVTGDVYMKKNNMVYRFDDTQKIIIIAVGLLVMGMTLVRLNTW